MKKAIFYAIIFMLLVPLALTAGAATSAKAKKSARKRPPFVPLDLKKFFTAGPLSDPQPPSTLLPAGATTVELSLTAATPTRCRYSVGQDRPFEAMTPFDSQTPSPNPETAIRGLDSNPSKVNDVYIRCAASPGAVLHLQYRALPAVKPGFPRTANLWGSYNFIPKGMEYAARIDLWLGANFKPDQILALRRLNPNIYILNSINTVENNDVPDDYFLRDTTGQKIEVWPGAYRLNLTRPEVAEYQARYAYQKMLESGLTYDGCFFDNFMMTQRWLTRDIYGRPLTIDANGDGKPDNKEWFDTAWREGVFHELKTWRKLMPWALATGHSQGYPYPEIAEIFNGQGIGFFTTDVIEGKRPFHELWDYYNAWCTVTVKPAITSVESAVPDQIAYGYDYSPQQKTPTSTWAFARDYYPYMRFGLAFTLMNDGYFMHELGDTHHGQDWWYDELDYKLGLPLGAARRVAIGQVSDHDLVDNGGFENDFGQSWRVWSNRTGGSEAAVARDTTEKHGGTASACINISKIPSGGGQAEFTQPQRPLQAGKSYDLKFWAKAESPQTIILSASKSVEPWDNYGLRQEVKLSRQWQEYTVTFMASVSASDSRLQFICGTKQGRIWLDDVTLREHGGEVFRRDFERGTVLLNATRQRQTIEVGPGYARLKGNQAPKYQYIVDDLEPGSDAANKTAQAKAQAPTKKKPQEAVINVDRGFKATGPWSVVELETKEWNAIPPYYHAWNVTCHKLSGGTGEASWDLALRGPGTYTIQAWWAAPPEEKTWTTQAVFEVMASGKVVATKTLDQTQAGDQWHTIAENLALKPEDKPFVRLKNAASGALIADALHIFSAERYNDGSVTKVVTLEPMDGIVLRKE